MKSLLAIFAVGAALALGAAAPAAAKTVDEATLACLVLDRPDGRVVNTCVCLTVHNIDWEIKQKLPVDPSRLGRHCPAGGGEPSFASSSDEPDDHDKGHGFSFSKATSSSGVVSIGTFYGSNRDTVIRTLTPVRRGLNPLAITIQGEDTSAFAAGNGSANAEAGSHGGASATTTSHGLSSGAGGSTGGGTCAGSGCGGNIN